MCLERKIWERWLRLNSSLTTNSQFLMNNLTDIDTPKKKKKKPSKNTSKHQMRKPLVQYMYVTLVIINTVGQCLMILKPKGG